MYIVIPSLLFEWFIINSFIHTTHINMCTHKLCVVYIDTIPLIGHGNYTHVCTHAHVILPCHHLPFINAVI